MAEGDSVAVDFDLTPEEWVEVCLEHSAQSVRMRKAFRQVRVLFAALIVVGALLGFLGGGVLPAIVWLFAGSIAGALMPRTVARMQKKQFEQFAQEGIANGMFGPHRVELTDEGMRDSTDGYEWLTRWSAIDRIEDTDAAFLIYTGPNSFLPIPHSAFRDSATLRAFADRFFGSVNAARTFERSGEPAALVADPTPSRTSGVREGGPAAAGDDG